jgi:hypothetical protein
MASEPSELGDEAAGDELGGVSFMVAQKARRVVERLAGGRGTEGER